MKLLYIANARLPTEKAHGIQIMKMCQAFTNLGMQVTLLHPYRHQPDSTLSCCSVHEYYGVQPVFEVRTLANFDILLLERFFPRGVFTPLFFAHALGWGLYATLIARRQRADLYYTRSSEVLYWLVLLGLPTVYEAHVVPRRGLRWLLKTITQKSALKLVVVLTNFIREQFIKIGFPEEKVVVLPDSVDLSLFDGLPGKEECRRRLGLPLGRLIIGYIGRFHTMEMEKGIPELVQAMARLPSLNGEPLLLCVGGPMDPVPSYLKLARSCNVPEHRLKFMDRVPNSEVPLWIKACDIVTIPWTWTEFSAYFTSPLKLFEYMAAEVPIVASRLPSIQEVLRHGENAWLVEPGDPKALAEGIAKLLKDTSLQDRLAGEAVRDVQNYTWTKRAKHILEYWKKQA